MINYISKIAQEKKCSFSRSIDFFFFFFYIDVTGYDTKYTTRNFQLGPLL